MAYVLYDVLIPALGVLIQPLAVQPTGRNSVNSESIVVLALAGHGNYLYISESQLTNWPSMNLINSTVMYSESGIIRENRARPVKNA